eukprot:2163603-Prymnesium_polylepis.1
MTSRSALTITRGATKSADESANTPGSPLPTSVTSASLETVAGDDLPPELRSKERGAHGCDGGLTPIKCDLTLYKNASVYKSIWGRGPKLGYNSFTPPPAQRGWLHDVPLPLSLFETPRGKDRDCCVRRFYRVADP